MSIQNMSNKEKLVYQNRGQLCYTHTTAHTVFLVLLSPQTPL